MIQSFNRITGLRSELYQPFGERGAFYLRPALEVRSASLPLWRQGDQLAGLGLTGLIPCIEAAAKLHAHLWDDPRLAQIPWLSRDNGDLIRALFPQLYLGFRERYATRLAPDLLDVGAGIVDRLDLPGGVTGRSAGLVVAVEPATQRPTGRYSLFR